MKDQQIAPLCAKHGLLMPIYPLRDVMLILGIKKSTMYKLFKSGHLHPKKMLGKTILMADDIALFIEMVRRGEVV